MLTARDRRNAILIADTAERSDEYHCPECLESVVLKRGAIVVPHFAHKANTLCLPDDRVLNPWSDRIERSEVRVPAEIRYIHASAYGHMYVLTSEGEVQACHLERAGSRDTDYGSYTPKTLKWLSFHKAGKVPIKMLPNENGLRLVKFSEGIWWKRRNGT